MLSEFDIIKIMMIQNKESVAIFTFPCEGRGTAAAVDE